MSRSERTLATGTDDRSDGPAGAGAHAADSGGDQDVSGLVATLEQLAGAGALSPEQVRAIVSATVRLYATASECANRELPPVTHDVSTTDALTLACALVRSQDLTPFEMAVWFSRGRQTE